MEQFIEFFKVTGPWACILLGGFIVLNLIGEIVEKTGKIVPEFMKIRKFFTRKSSEKKSQKKLLADVKVLIEDFNSHYSTDNIQKRNEWMSTVNKDLQWMHQRADKYDQSIDRIVDTLSSNTKMTEDMFVEDSRDRIIGFAEKVVNPQFVVSREQFRRIFRIYDEYEAFLKARSRTNGEVDESIASIRKAYSYRQKHHSFAEDLNLYIE